MVFVIVAVYLHIARILIDNVTGKPDNLTPLTRNPATGNTFFSFIYI
jgi:hypothetical protein